MLTIDAFFRDHPQAAVAFSGGVDSAWLLHEAVRCCERTAAYFVRTPFQPDFELEDARDTARLLGASLTVLEFDILRVPLAAANGPDRCYHCKKALFTLLLEAAGRDGFPLVLDGGNASDDAGDRPGMRALRELGVRAPLRECGVDKAEIRRQSRAVGLPVWDKPSYACLATRVPTGTPVTAELLGRASRGETLLFELGFSDFRLRLRGAGALLQVRWEQMEKAREALEEIRRRLAEDFTQIELDDVPRESRET